MLEIVKFEAKIQLPYFKFGFINVLLKMEKWLENSSHKVVDTNSTTVQNSIELNWNASQVQGRKYGRFSLQRRLALMTYCKFDDKLSPWSGNLLHLTKFPISVSKNFPFLSRASGATLVTHTCKICLGRFVHTC